MEETDKILYRLGYYDSDPAKKAEIQGYIAEAIEFMTAAGLKTDAISSQRGYAIKSIWADARDRGEPDAAIKRDGMITYLIAQMRPRGGG